MITDQSTQQPEDDADAMFSADYHKLRMELAEKLLLPAAMAGELWAIRNLMLILSEAVADGQLITPGLSHFFSSALRKIYDGLPADDAFGIKRKRGEKDIRKINQKQYMFASAVERLREGGATLEEAISEVGDRSEVSENTIKKAWNKYHKSARREIGLEKEYLGKVMPITLP